MATEDVTSVYETSSDLERNVTYNGEQRTWIGDHPILSPLCTPELFVLLIERRLNKVVIGAPATDGMVSGDFEVKEDK